MAYIFKRIRNCRSCGYGKIVDIIHLGKMPIPNFSEKPKLHKAPLTLVLCPKCKLLQLKETVNPSLLWNKNYGYQSGMNNEMKNELKDIVKRAEKLIKLQKEDVVLDIGCNDGTMLSFYKASKIKKIGFDPSENVIKIAKEKLKDSILINDFFSAKRYLKEVGKKAKIITAIAMFYDINDPNIFLRDVINCLDKNGIFIIQQNYALKMIKNNAIDNIVHEHLTYYSINSLNKLLKRNNFEVFDIEFNEVNGGSFRIYAKMSKRIYPQTKKDKIDKLVKYELKKNLNNTKTYINFGKKAIKNLKLTKELILKERRMGKKIFIYGASTRGSTLVNLLKLNKELVEKAADKNLSKWGKKYAGTNIEIISEKQARQEKPDYFLVLPWYFRAEFIKREKEYLKNGGKLIFPLPKLEIYPPTSPTTT